MAPKLYMSEMSPAVRAVQLTAKAINLELECVILDMMKQEHLKPEFIKLNPQHTIPTLQDDDGTVVWESHAIMPYLVGKYGKSAFYPNDLKRRAVIDQRLHFETGLVFHLLHDIVAPVFMKKAGPEIAQEKLEKADQIYGHLNTFLEGNAWIAGNEITIADFSLLPSVTSLNLVVPIDAKHANVLAWIKRAEKLPYYEANAKGLQLFHSVVKTLFPQLA